MILINLMAPTMSGDHDDCDIYILTERYIDFLPYED